jgi:hypothetical protein
MVETQFSSLQARANGPKQQCRFLQEWDEGEMPQYWQDNNKPEKEWLSKEN